MSPTADASSSPSPDPAEGPAELPDVVGILGAGRAGTALARAIARIPVLAPGAAAPQVLLAATRSPAAVQRHLLIHAPGARAVRPEELADRAAVTVVAVPREDLDDVDPDLLAGPRTLAVVDMTNSWGAEPVPDWLSPAALGGAPGSVALADRWAAAGLSAPVVRAFSEVSHHELDRDGVAEGSRRALGVGTERPGPGRDAVAALVRAMGYEPVEYAPLARASALEPGAPAFHTPSDAARLARLLA